MRALLVVVMLARIAGAVEDDDPKAGRLGASMETGHGGPVPLTVPLPDEDDPKLARGSVRKSRLSYGNHPVPRVKLAYRLLQTAGLDRDRLTFHAVELDYYPSSGWLRFGLETQAGFAGAPYGAWYLTVGAVLGLQWPMRVTPFVDARFAAGLIGATFLGQSAVSYLYMGGLEAGIELYVAGRFHLTTAIGWAHPVYSGIDAAYVRAHPMLDPARIDLAADTVTFKVGLGL